MRVIVLLSMPLAPILAFFETYIFGDWEFVKFLVVLMILDTLLGFVKHWISCDVSSKAYGMIGKKILVYASILALSHVLATFRIDGIPVESFTWFRYLACSALIVREGVSIIENSEEIMPGLFPKSVVRRLKGFNNSTGEKNIHLKKKKYGK